MNDMPNLATRARTLFRDACNDIDGATLQRLRQARRAALAAPPASRLPKLLLPAGALAMSVLAATLVWQDPMTTVSPAGEDFTIAATIGDTAVPDDDVDLYDNLDFYTWLATQPSVASGGR